VDKASLDYGAPIAGSGNEGYRPDLSRAVMRDGAQDIALDAIDHGVEGLAEPSGALRDGVEHRLHVGRRTADNAQDLAGGRLLFQGLADLGVSVCEGAVLFLELGEQAHVLDGDDGLVGKGLEQANL